MAGISTNRSDITLPSEVSAEILQKVQGASAVMQLARQVTLPGRGLTIPVISSDPSASWVAETDEKPVSNPGLGTKLMEGYTLAVILPFSNQFRRDDRALYDALVARLPGALALKFDQTVVGAVAKPGANFDNLAGCTAQSLIAGVGHTVYDGLVAAFGDIADEGYMLDGFGLSPAAVGILLGAVDNDGRPLFINSAADGAVPRILSARTVMGRGLYKAGSAAAGSDPGSPAIIGVAGDWTQAMYGTVEGVQISISDQATLTSGTTVINLWQRNMFAVRAEIEVGFRCQTAAFNLLTGATPES
ncbi:MAG: phage major capsid protein [Clostridia bacterium]|nr:phage major capsid protein [Clostridia bacterium]